MTIRFAERELVRCDGTFSVFLRVDNESNENIRARVELTGQFDVNVENLAIDQRDIDIGPGEFRQLVIDGNLADQCANGEFEVIGDRVVDNNVIPNTHESLLIVLSKVPFRHTDTSPDPVVADTNGAFNYGVTLACCPGGAAVQRTLEYNARAAENATDLSVDPPGPRSLDCPGDDDLIEIEGRLIDVSRKGVVEFKVTGPGRCFVLTEVFPPGTEGRGK